MDTESVDGRGTALGHDLIVTTFREFGLAMSWLSHALVLDYRSCSLPGGKISLHFF